MKINTIDELREKYPNVLNANIIADFLGLESQQVRHLAQMGKFPFAVSTENRHYNDYLFPTERFIAWYEGRLKECDRSCVNKEGRKVLWSWDPLFN